LILSSTKTNEFALNTASKFSNVIEQTNIGLKNEYEVALTSISYPCMYKIRFATIFLKYLPLGKLVNDQINLYNNRDDENEIELNFISLIAAKEEINKNNLLNQFMNAAKINDLP